MVPLYEADEYVEIVNLGDGAQNLAGWVLVDISDGCLEFQFPSSVLDAGGIIRVYTNEVHSEWGGKSFGRGSAVWSNSDPDTAGLYSETGEPISTMTYPSGCE